MIFPKEYKALKVNSVGKEGYSLMPIRYQDRFDIMRWRNEQMHHLRQNETLTEYSQETYFRNTINPLFEQEEPNQFLFSYLKGEKCIGYGGLVHIDWLAKKAEVSFIMNTELENLEFEFHWSTYLELLKEIAFIDLNFNSIFTYAYNLRPQLYPMLEKNQFVLKERIKEAIEIKGERIDVLVHECKNPRISLNVRVCQEKDVELVYHWSNDGLVRSQSFDSNEIKFEDHELWFSNKIKNSNSLLLVNEFDSKPVGLVRFEVGEEDATIGILVDRTFRGKGLSSLMLIKSIEEYIKSFSKPILAYIKENNEASVKAFKKAGFAFEKKDLVNGFPTLVFKFRTNE